MSEYHIEEIEEFLRIDKELKNSEENRTLQKLLSVQSKISIFNGISQDDLQAIVYKLEFNKFKFKDQIVKQDEIRDEIFFIISGVCQVFHNNKKVGELKAGEIFGEVGALFKSKRGATVACASKELTLLSFCIDEQNMEFCAPALARLYKNLAYEIDAKLKNINSNFSKK